MSAKNRFESIQGSIDRKIRSERSLRTLLTESYERDWSRPCVFLSHYGKDKASVVKIAAYFDSVGVDYYLDIKDHNLQKAVDDRDEVLISQFIELGIKNSTHLLAILSEQTKESWWVSYEIGFAKRDGVGLAHLVLREVRGKLPEFLNITQRVSDIKGLNRFISERKSEKPITRKRQFDVLVESLGYGEGIVAHDASDHPLKGVLRG